MSANIDRESGSTPRDGRMLSSLLSRQRGRRLLILGGSSLPLAFAIGCQSPQPDTASITPTKITPLIIEEGEDDLEWIHHDRYESSEITRQLGESYKQGIIATSTDLIADSYLTNGLRFPKYTNSYWARNKIHKVSSGPNTGSFVVGELVTTQNESHDQQFYIYNYYAPDRITILKRELTPHVSPDHLIALASLPGRPFGAFQKDIPEAALEEVANSIWDLPSSLKWEPDTDQVNTPPYDATALIYQARRGKATSPQTGRKYEVYISQVPRGKLTVTEPQ